MDEDRAFAELYGGLRRFAAVVGTLGDDPDDLVQEAVARTLRRGSLADLEDPGPYLRRVIVNLVRTEHRNASTRWRILSRLRSVDAHVDEYPSDWPDLADLSPQQRAVLYLRFVENRSIAEIADVLALNEPAVRARLSRALKALRVELERSTVDGHG